MVFFSIGCTAFPHDFCAVRWLANIPVCQRAVFMWPFVQGFMKNLIKKNAAPKTKSFQNLQGFSSDPLLEIKAEIFLTLAGDLSWFLRSFQSSAPMMPFLASALKDVLTNLLNRLPSFYFCSVFSEKLL